MLTTLAFDNAILQIKHTETSILPATGFAICYLDLMKPHS